MIRRPPRSTLFPTRRSSDLAAPRVDPRVVVGDAEVVEERQHLHGERLVQLEQPDVGDVQAGQPRSEEHTSELQSRQYLVCRLLLEKKKKFSSRHLSTTLIFT